MPYLDLLNMRELNVALVGSSSHNNSSNNNDFFKLLMCIFKLLIQIQISLIIDKEAISEKSSLLSLSSLYLT